MRPRTLVITSVAVVALLAGCGGGPKTLAPLRDSPTTSGGGLGLGPATTAPAEPGPGGAALAALRSRLEQDLQVPDPSGYHLDTAALDRDPGTLSPGLEDQFAGAGFVHGMVRIWFDAGGHRLSLAIYAFQDAAGARQAWSCGCPGPPLAGVPDSSVVTYDDGVGADAAVGSYVVRASSDVQAWTGGTHTVETLLREARNRILATGAERAASTV